MANGTPGRPHKFRLQIVNADGKDVAHVVNADLAATLVSALGNGATIQDRTGTVLWTEGTEGDGIASENQGVCISRCAKVFVGATRGRKPKGFQTETFVPSARAKAYESVCF